MKTIQIDQFNVNKAKITEMDKGFILKLNTEENFELIDFLSHDFKNLPDLCCYVPELGITTGRCFLVDQKFDILDNELFYTAYFEIISYE
jgi:hypothetical protein